MLGPSALRTSTSPPARPTAATKVAASTRSAMARMVARAQLVDPFDLDAGGPRALDVRPHLGQHGGEVADLRFPGGVLDHGRALGEHGGHQDVVGCGVARELQDDAGADEAVAVALHVAVLGDEARPEVLEGAQVEVDRPVAEVVTAGHRDPGGAVTGEQRPEHDDRGPHLLDELVGGDRRHVVGHGDLEVTVGPTALVAHLGPHGPKHVGHDRDVADHRDVVEAVQARGEQAGGHELQDRVLRPVHLDRALERSARAQHEAIHGETVLPVAARGHRPPADARVAVARYRRQP